ncbi:hypothetical protein EHI8A_004660 [Entamoeba histolytica HM-1:IMSS-B]|uniref:Transmembrane protein n=6 Tax=Entamoeba histolytica TaxID=5759 RepID=C4M3L7_ENTH1|nr:hypothetical protein EHI_109990 [Entamoeba histolytica HM-1:IMSS]EMD42517.1 Hypothetical protein EHI5A_019200 [Entamoeba histolytica KU27]EMH73814.1 hypothetical protein EHI8A_004660 [Entamoeba histolytica HM-1:IMSS-B]EMS17124.1 hypothetical protein KM1_012960 [Entamoeba histolytica HM-3:IMSS]ENY64584.1 hypothetical protein EHI7A_069980 [Entamoeba histolytica HM-1:IMSS-A]GAT95918.1 hypothetical protein CL6EHI_109990 [Entamoeba histolytica]|eukprot:XP_652196.1 hypothetical protein EHI_109990 [Entamoeba histolytica HM-1:IMSS]
MFILFVAFIISITKAENIYSVSYANGKLSVVDVYEDKKCYKIGISTSVKYAYVAATDSSAAKIEQYTYLVKDCSDETIQPEDFPVTAKKDIKTSNANRYYLYNEEPDNMKTECSLITNNEYDDDNCTIKVSEVVSYMCNIPQNFECHQYSQTNFYYKTQTKVGYYGTFYFLDKNCTQEANFGKSMIKCGVCSPILVPLDKDKQVVYSIYQCEDECITDGSVSTFITMIIVVLFFFF